MAHRKRTRQVLQELRTRWWWFNRDFKPFRSDAAVVWETLRRTRFYCKLWATRQECMKNLTNLTLPDGSQIDKVSAKFLQTQFLLGTIVNVTGSHEYKMLLQQFNPERSWINLTDSQRRIFRGFTKLYGRQSQPRIENCIGLAICKLARNGKGILEKLDDHWGGKFLEFPNVLETEEFQALPVSTPTSFLVVRFDYRLSEAILTRSFDKRLGELLLKTKTPNPMVEWSHLSQNKSNYPKLWEPDFSQLKHQPHKEVFVIPSPDFPQAYCFIPTTCPINVARARFKTTLRKPKKNIWIRAFDKKWGRRTTRIGSGLRALHLIRTKSAKLKHPWFGLSMFDLVGNHHLAKEYLIENYERENPEAFHADIHKFLQNQKRAFSALVQKLDSQPRTKWASEISKSANTIIRAFTRT